MTSAYLDKATVLLVVFFCASTVTCLRGAENDNLRNIAERFVRQIEERDTDTILQSYPMTNEFRAGMPNADTVTGWAREIDQLFGRLGDVVRSEIIDQEQGLRSVYLHYQGTKRPVKIWVTFSGTVIDGFHYDVWAEGYTESERSVQRSIEWFAHIGFIVAIVLVVLLPFAVPIIAILGEKEPTVNIDNGIEISGIWRVKIDFAKIANISLMEDKIDSIGLTWRTCGYATGTTLKGYFRSSKYGSVLLFTRTDSSPTIHIQRKDKADVFLNFSNNEATRALYNDMKTALPK